MSWVALLLAGGKSSRMGEDKALLPFGGYGSLAEYQYRRLEGFFDQVYIATKEEKFDFNPRLIMDRYPQSSPLVALVSAFELLSVEELFVVSVDAPFVDRVLIHRLYGEAQEGDDVIVARSLHGREPLCGIYRSSILPVAKEHLLRGDHRLGHLLDAVACREVFCEDSKKFWNLNYPEEYAKAYRLSSSI